MKGIFTNINGGNFPVTILAMNDKRTHYAGGGKPFHVDSVEVVYDFGPGRFRSGNIVHAEGYRRGNKIMFFGSCADSGFTTSLEVAA